MPHHHDVTDLVHGSFASAAQRGGAALQLEVVLVPEAAAGPAGDIAGGLADQELPAE
jgi:hypothetical protein